MKYLIPEEINIQALPLTTQVQLKRLLNEQTKPVNVAQLKCVRIKKGLHEDAVYCGLAFHLFRLIEEYNENMNKEEV